MLAKLQRSGNPFKTLQCLIFRRAFSTKDPVVFYFPSCLNPFLFFFLNSLVEPHGIVSGWKTTRFDRVLFFKFFFQIHNSHRVESDVARTRFVRIVRALYPLFLYFFFFKYFFSITRAGRHNKIL